MKGKEWVGKRAKMEWQVKGGGRRRDERQRRREKVKRYEWKPQVSWRIWRQREWEAAFTSCTRTRNAHYCPRDKHAAVMAAGSMTEHNDIFFHSSFYYSLKHWLQHSKAVETHSCVVFESHFSSTGVQGSIVGFTARFHRLSNLTLLRSSNNETTTPATATAKALRSSRLGEGPGLSMSSSAIDIAMCAALPVT